MRPGRRSPSLVTALVLIGVVLAASLAVVAIVAPVLIIVELVVIAAATALVSRLRPGSRRRRAGEVGPAGPDGMTEPDRHVRIRTPEPRWVTRWESAPPASVVPMMRDQLTQVLTGWGVAGEAAEPTRLVVTELVSNAMEHARAPIELTVCLLGGSVRVEVHDAATDPPRQQPRDPWKERGRGLQLVDALCLRWGWTDDVDGKTVWADVPIGWPIP